MVWGSIFWGGKFIFAYCIMPAQHIHTHTHTKSGTNCMQNKLLVTSGEEYLRFFFFFFFLFLGGRPSAAGRLYGVDICLFCQGVHGHHLLHAASRRVSLVFNEVVVLLFCRPCVLCAPGLAPLNWAIFGAIFRIHYTET